MPKEESVEMQGVVLDAVRGAFHVKVDESEHIVFCTLAGSMRQHFIRVVPGDRVTIEVSPYDPERGRIKFRAK